MSFKAAKNLKKFPSEQPEQLDLVETISDADKINKKRSSIIIFLILTVGLSLCFIAYRQFQNLNFKQIKTPNLSLKLPALPQSKFSPDIPENWSFFVRTIDTMNYFFSTESLENSSNVSEKFNQNVAKVNSPHTPSYAKKYLPDGVVISEKINSTSDYFEIFSQISTPKVKFEIYTKIPGNINSNSSDLDTYSKLVEVFYWHLLK